MYQRESVSNINLNEIHFVRILKFNSENVQKNLTTFVFQKKKLSNIINNVTFLSQGNFFFIVGMKYKEFTEIHLELQSLAV